ncbi:flagellar hook-basal body complex protein FliE [Caldisalinibacter kiritimatiensis]|uniref:Flagellar hook-basal body complex protein FliE n=1 Tax=Caldisalinibacter kiritimatiensis TaxID=1304284 RepID=R1CKQ7_9FIRM|nr:flagellar hook-basal body complex protein FliE [Caldisalinibacter kiritimatiensis]EOC99310.1 Flagellar hook-basal body complex protein FliE [Caldisalinibacter kiritimatiensis]
MSINNIQGINFNKALNNIENISNQEKNKSDFGDYLFQELDKVKSLQVEANNYNRMLSTGKINNIHEVMIATEKANIALQFTLSIRNKVIDAYKEITRMQI